MKIRKKVICVDLDGTICSLTKGNYLSAKPKMKAVKKINSLYMEGHKIIIFTARFMGRNRDNKSEAKRQGYKLTLKQLKKWNLKFHKLIMGKPSYDVLIDDKAFGFNNDWLKKNF